MDPRKTAGHTRGGHELKTPPKSESTGFAVFRLRPELLRATENLGWTTPTPVQLEAIPPALAGHDLIALAQTGTGKTGAFLLPLLDAISALPSAKPRKPYCVILAPTRELVQQIDVQAKALSQGLRLRSMTIFGGVSERPQIAQLKMGVDLVAATPGRLLDLISQGMIDFSEVKYCVLDESDRMFDMGFIRDLKRILSHMPSRRQTLLFSATMPPEIQHLTQEFLHRPREVRLSVSLPPPELSHEVWEVDTKQKNAALESLLSEDHDSVLVFTRTKHRADSVARRLARSGETVAVLHGNRSQNQRDHALARFKQGQARVLVATDVASRGLDIDGIGLVINYDTPRDPGDYIHRVGRTARAKRKGCAISLMIDEEIKYIRKIEQLLKHRIVRRQQSLPLDPSRSTSAEHSQQSRESSVRNSRQPAVPEQRREVRKHQPAKQRAQRQSQGRSETSRESDGGNQRTDRRGEAGQSSSGRSRRSRSRSGPKSAARSQTRRGR